MVSSLMFVATLCSAQTSYDNSPYNYKNSPYNFENSQYNFKNCLLYTSDAADE